MTMLARATKAFTEHVKDVTEKTVAKTCCGKSAKINNNNNNVELSAYIFDSTTGTTYLKGKLLGKGGFARCYELTDLRTNKTYAGKIISKTRLSKPHQKEKIAREIELHRNLRHRHVVAFQSCFEDEENVYIVLETCSRKSLVHMLKNRKLLTEPEVRYFLRQLVEGCKYIHNQQIIHRDLKLGNMLINDNMEMKIADFGLATKVEYEGERKMTVCGTPNYIAPEVLQKQGHSYEADIWAIGCVVYALLVGRPPFETATLKETYIRIANNKYTLPHSLSTAAKNLLRKLLNPNPQSRPTLDNILADEFFSVGYTPKALSPTCCSSAPMFPVSNTILSRPKSYAAPVSPTDAVHKITSSIAHFRGNKKPHSLHVEVTNQQDNDAQMSPSVQDVIRETVKNTLNGQKRNSTEVKALPLGSAIRLHQMLGMCLDQMPEDSVPSPVDSKPLWVVKWVDYSNKYGFGFQLSNRSVGVLFNDTTRMLLESDGRTIQYFDVADTQTTFTTDAVPTDYQIKATLVMYFAQYMDEHLIQGGDMESQNQTGFHGNALYMKKWFRTSKAIVMYLSNGTLQVNFFEDHTKVVVSPDGQDYFVTFINSDRQATTYRLLQLRHFGCKRDIAERMEYAKNMLQTIIDIEGDEI